MSSKTIKMAISDALSDLSKEQLSKFRHQLLDRREEPVVRRNKVEGRDYLDITDVLVSTFTEPGAREVTVELLRQIGCNNEADRLVRETSGESLKPGSSNTARPSAGAAGNSVMTEGKHFVDKYKSDLIARVTNVGPILDRLFDKDILLQERYAKIHAMATTQEQIRALYLGPLQGGKECKDIFYSVLEENESYLIADLKKNN